MRTAGRWPPLMLTRPTPGSWEIFWASRVSTISWTWVSGSVFEVARERDDRRVGGIDLGVDRRRRQIGRQQIAGRVDRRLHLLLGGVEGYVEAELQGDDRGAGRTGRRHLVQAGHLAELPLQRRRHRRGHHLGTGARVEGGHLDGRIVDLRQGRQRQEAVADDADQQDRQHRQGRRHRPLDEYAGGVHASAATGQRRSVTRLLAGPGRLARLAPLELPGTVGPRAGRRP